MTMQQLCQKCEALNKEFNASARHMDGAEFSAFRKRLAMKYNVGFDNSWSARFCCHVSDTFTIEQMQVWTQTEKGLFGRSTAKKKMHLTLTSPAMPDVYIKCVSADAKLAEHLQNGAQIRISGELQISAFLNAQQVQWKDGEFGGRTMVKLF